MPHSVPDNGLLAGADGKLRPPWAYQSPLLLHYYDTEWGLPVKDEQGIFERLSLEVFQSGLSWATILAKRPAFQKAFAEFDPESVAQFGEADVDRLMSDAGIVRNERKIRATIANAQATIALRDQGGLPALIWAANPSPTPPPSSVSQIPTQSKESVELAKVLRDHGFRHVGPVTMFAMLEALGVVNTRVVGAYDPSS